MDDNKDFNEWLSTRLTDNDFIINYCANILAVPRFIVNPSEQGMASMEQLYTTQQMCDMFRLGFYAMSNTFVGKQMLKTRAEKAKKVENAPYKLIRNLSVGDHILFPYDKWSAARSAASRLHSQYGSVFKVTKLAHCKMPGQIEVIRVL